MEDNTQNSDEMINKAISDPEATIQSLDKAKDAIQQLMNTKKEVETSMQNGVQSESEGDSVNSWTQEDTIDTLLAKLTDGYTYYNLPWDDRNKPKASSDKYYINDEDGKNIQTTNQEGVIDYANTVFNYDMNDNDEDEFKTFDQAKEALESEGNFKVINVNDTNQLSLFPKKEVKPIEVENTVISKMDPISLEKLFDKLGNKAWVVKKVIGLLNDDKQQEAYKQLRNMLDVLKEEISKIEENFVNSEIFRIIAESETPKLKKSDILDYIKKQKK